jgi:uncharacterized damage-inducible protein DinB
MSDSFVPPEQDPRPRGNPVGELATYQEYLTHYRLTLDLKCQDLAPRQLAQRSVPPSNLSLLGLVRHMARVEHFWFQLVLRGGTGERMFDDGDAGFADVQPTDVAVTEAFDAWRAQVALADEWLADQADDALGEEVTFRDGTETSSRRDILVHMIEEYARHCGHADLLRECIDGRTGQ